ncbi:hypothetical protein Dimus_028503 [Dionaea muscipula]
MGGDKRDSKGGRYVGGFFQLFDWNTKSRKKLFTSKHDLPEQIKEGKTDEETSRITRGRFVDEEGVRVGSSVKGSSDYSCASSVTDEGGYGIRAPSVVARLMGLDSLPLSNVVEPHSSPSFGSHSPRDAPFRKKDLDLYHDHQFIHSSNLLDKVEFPARNSVEPNHQKTASKPIERFQTEILPPKSAKSIPVTHHKLLSPIKSPGFIPYKDAAHIMEAAAKIIEPGPQATSRSKISVAASSSAPLRVRELKEKLEAANRKSRVSGASQRPVDTSAAKCPEGKFTGKSLSSSVDVRSIPSDTDDSNASMKNNGKSISLAVQAKVNVRQREGMSSSNRSLDMLNESDEIRPSQFKTKPRSLKSAPKKSSAVLRQNNQKQNCSTDEDKLNSKSSVPNLRGRKTVSGNSSHGRSTSLCKDVGTSRNSRKSSLEARDCDKERLSSDFENIPRKRRSIDGNLQLQYEKNRVVDNMISNSCMPSKSITVADRHFTWMEESRKKGIDVVSFTFTAPMARSVAGSEPARQVGEKITCQAGNQNQNVLLSSDGSKLVSPGINIIGADALNILLEQKLRELTHGLEKNPHQITNRTGPSAVWQNMVSAVAESSLSSLQDNWNMDNQIYSAFCLTDHELPRRRYKLQGGEEDMDEHNNNRASIAKLEESRAPSPVSILEPSLLTESYNFSDSVASNITQENNQCPSNTSQKVFGLTSSTKDSTTEAEKELSDSASSHPRGDISAQDSQRKVSTSSSEWELDYLKSMLSNVDLMFKDYALGRTREVINPHLFDQLERRRIACLKADEEAETRLARKIVFDCASECLDLRYQQFVGGGGCKIWAKGVALVRRKGRLAEEVYREIQGWRSMGNCMVDELVDKDMSTQYGRWLDFEVDEFALGVEIEHQICDSLINEVIADTLLPVSCTYSPISTSAM